MPAQNTSIPKVPIRTDMFPQAMAQLPDGTKVSVDLGDMDRTWILFLERLPKGNGNPGAGGGGGGTDAAEIFQRTLLLKDTTVGDNIADQVPVYAVNAGTSATVIQVVGVLRQVITADLTVKLWVVYSGTSTAIGTFTIPHTTAVSTAVLFSSFSSSTLPLDGALRWDVTASDGSMSNFGVATFTVLWR